MGDYPGRDHRQKSREENSIEKYWARIDFQKEAYLRQILKNERFFKIFKNLRFFFKKGAKTLFSEK